MKVFRVIKNAILGYFQDQCFLHASSLTFYTLLSLVPLLAMAFGIAKGFGFEKPLEAELESRFHEHDVILTHMIAFAHSMLAQTEESWITGVGALFLFVFILGLFWTIENSLNAIWKVKRGRSLIRMLTDYLAMMLICPFIFVIATSLTVFVSTFFHGVIVSHAALAPLSQWLFVLSKAFSLILIWILFLCIYLVMPNTPVRFRDAIFGAIIAGSLYMLLQTTIVQFQIGVSQYNAIYGSFAALPLFLLLMQIGWTLVLFGAELTYHAEALSTPLTKAIKQTKITIAEFALVLTQTVIRHFKSGHPSTLQDLSEELNVSIPKLREGLIPLIDSKVLVEVKSDKVIFHPGKDPEHLTFFSVLQAIDPNLNRSISVAFTEDVKNVSESYKTIQGSLSNLKVL